jgi:hypothetical protein
MNLNLRSISVERLPDEDEKAADNKAKPRSLFNKSKAMTDNAFNRGKR